MGMSFGADCPRSWQPAGFRSADRLSIDARDWHNLWEGPSTMVTSFAAAHHLVKIAVRNKEYNDQSTSQLHDTLMSRHLHNMQRTSSQYAGLKSTLPIPATPSLGEQVMAGSHECQISKRAPAEAASDHDVQSSADEPLEASVARPSPCRRKISISGRFVQVDRSSPATGVSLDEENMDACASGKSGETGWSEDDFN